MCRCFFFYPLSKLEFIKKPRWNTTCGALSLLRLCTNNQRVMVILIVHECTLSSYTVLIVIRLAMWYRLLKPYFRFGWSSNVLRRSLHILLGNGDSPPNCVNAWHPQRPAILEDAIIYRYLSWLLFFSLARFF